MKYIRIFWLCMLFLSLFISENVFATKAKDIDLETLIAGVKHNDSLIEKGKVHFFMQPVHTKLEAKLFGNFGFETKLREVIFAFDGGKVYYEIPSDSEPYMAIFDGEKQVDIYKQETQSEAKRIKIGVRDSLTIDPRSYFQYWGLSFDGQTIGEYLEKNAVAIVGKGNIDKVLCYIIEAKRRGGTIRFWIAPSMGYRILKRSFDIYYAQSGGFPATAMMLIRYEKSKDNIWFPKSGTDTTIALNKATGKKELMFKYSLTVKNFELNVDVSDLFKLDIPPETEVFDFRTNSQRTAKDAGVSR
jgi:hypothetical protein